LTGNFHAEDIRETGIFAVLIRRIAANDEALSELHRSRPAGMDQHLLSAELHARGLDRFSYNTPSLRTAVHLVDWDSGREIWPPPRPSMAAAFAAIAMPSYDRRFTADWAKDNEQRDAVQRAGQQRVADYYALQTRQQEERENKEARERFAASQRKRHGGSKTE
jgi:hypothetical protein